MYSTQPKHSPIYVDATILWAILWIIKEQGILLYIPDIQKHSTVFAYEQRLAKCANTKS